LILFPVILLLAAAWLGLGLPTPKCAFHQFTGLPCLTCGSTRAAGALLHGEGLAALRWNPLAAAGLLGMAAAWGYAAAVCLLGWRRFRPKFSRATGWALRLLLVLVLLANWIYLVRTLP